MKTKYSNPYFKNAEVHSKLLKFIDKRKPKLNPNPNINTFEESLLPIPEKTNRTQASWLKSPSSVPAPPSFNDLSVQNIIPQLRTRFAESQAEVSIDNSSISQGPSTLAINLERIMQE